MPLLTVWEYTWNSMLGIGAAFTTAAANDKYYTFYLLSRFLLPLLVIFIFASLFFSLFSFAIFLKFSIQFLLFISRISLAWHWIYPVSAIEIPTIYLFIPKICVLKQASEDRYGCVLRFSVCILWKDEQSWGWKKERKKQRCGGHDSCLVTRTIIIIGKENIKWTTLAANG